jgi:hypothetical protein
MLEVQIGQVQAGFATCNARGHSDPVVPSQR